MAGYIQWLARQEHLGARLTARQSSLRGEATGSHARTPENIANLMLGIETMLQYAVAIEAITPQQSEGYRQSAWDALRNQARTQETYLQDATPTRRFMALIRAVVSSGRGHIAGVNGGNPGGDYYGGALGWHWREIGPGGWEPLGRLIGWIDGTHNLYLDPISAYAEAQVLANTEGQPLPVSAKELWKRLDEAGLLVSKDPGLTSTRKYVGGTRKRVLHLDAVRILGLVVGRGAADGVGDGGEDKADGEDADDVAASGR
jgi:hypothetical protein